MRLRLVVSILVLCGSYFLLTQFTELRSYRRLPLEDLAARSEEINAQLAQTQEATVRRPLLIENVKIGSELLIRHYYLDSLMVILSIMALFLWVSQRLRRAQSHLPKNRDAAIRDMSVNIESAREEYIDEWDLDRRTTEGFRTKDEAIRHIKSDPLLKCDYCNGQLRSTFTGQREAVQLITFYKSVPTGAKDLRVVLGTYWFVRYASELKCAQCGRTVSR